MSRVTAINGQLVIGDSGETPKDEAPNAKTQSVIDWLEANDDNPQE